MPQIELSIAQDIAGAVTAFVISLFSGAISIIRRIIAGYSSSALWVLSEFMTAVLCGYLMYNAYPYLAPSLPEFITLPVAVAFVAHSGGRIFQETESALIKQFKAFKKD